MEGDGERQRKIERGRERGRARERERERESERKREKERERERERETEREKKNPSDQALRSHLCRPWRSLAFLFRIPSREHEGTSV